MSEETETKAEEAKTEPVQADETKADEAKADEAKADEAKTSVQQSADDDGAVLDARGRERPRFLLAFPEHPDLARLAAAFEAGNYALVREEAEPLAERAENPAVRDAALELRRRIEPDPLVKYLLALTAALLLFLTYFAYNH
ncbi:MAG TPA: hypothetical protein VEX18_12455 [Polyangiaceae bacterium]|nr:hypothetical protein [Polyangiaceae bacterium]